MAGERCADALDELLADPPDVGTFKTVCRGRKTDERGYRDLVTWRNDRAIYQVYQCPVATWKAGTRTVELRNCGELTKLVKDRINKVLPGHMHIYQKDFDWFLQTPDGAEPWEDPMPVNLDDIRAQEVPNKGLFG